MKTAQLTKIYRFGVVLVSVLLIGSLCAAQQYNPLKDDPLDTIQKGVWGDSSAQTDQQKDQQEIQESEDGIQFDPEKGIILPEERSGTSQRELDVKNRGEDFLYSQLEKKSQPPPAPEDPDKGYIDRQIDQQFTQIGEYLKEVGGMYKKGFSWVLDKVLFVLAIIKEWPLIKNPPPLFLSLPLLGLLYFLICYPLMKIGRTVTNSEWMAWVPVLQLVLLLKITERSMWSLLVFIIPVANLFLLAIIFMEICDMFRQPPYYGLAILVPGLNVALLWYLAYVEFD